MSIAESQALQYLSDAESYGSIKVVTRALNNVDADTLKRMALKVANSDQDAIVILGSSNETTHLVAAAGSNLLTRGVDVGRAVRIAAERAGCRGGGTNSVAQTGGLPRERIQEFVRQVRDALVHDLSDKS